MNHAPFCCSHQHSDWTVCPKDKYADEEQPTKLLFRLEKDDDGEWPPVDIESVWAAKQADGTLILRNTPFFASGVSNNDTVSAVEVDGELWFDRVVKRSGHGTIRVVVYEASENGTQHYIRSVRKFGCEAELSHLDNLFAVDLLPDADITGLLHFLQAEHEAEHIDYEESDVSWKQN